MEEKGIPHVIGVGPNESHKELIRKAEELKKLHDEANTIIINGDKYRLKEQQRGHIGRSKSMLFQMALMYSSLMGESKLKERPRVDLVKEFELIQQKKSKLSRSDRDWVVSQFNKHFEQL